MTGLDERGAAVRVGVVIPHFNSTSTLTRAIASARGQTVAPSRIVIVDDCSTETESQMLLDALERDSGDDLVIVRFERNKGPSAARNAGWNLIDADYVAFLDSDDTWDSRKLEFQTRAMQEARAMVSAHLLDDFSASERARGRAAPRSSQVLTPNHLLFRSRIATSSVVVSSTVAERFPEDMRYCEDLDLWMQLAARNGGILLLNRVLGHQYKAAFGASGLSGNLPAMELGQRTALRRSRERGDVSELAYRLAAGFGILRYLRRVAIARLRNRGD